MAAIVRGARAGRGGHGRDMGRQRGPAIPDAPAQGSAPLGHQWLYWKGGNSNFSGKRSEEEEEECRIYKKLEASIKIAPEELFVYGLTETLSAQREDIVESLIDLIALYNRIAKLRRKWLSKRLDGCQSKEMDLMKKKLLRDTDDTESRIQEIRSAGGLCPALPAVFDKFPSLI